MTLPAPRVGLCSGALAVCLLFAGVHQRTVSADDQINVEALLSQLRAFDGLYQSAITARGTLVETELDDERQPISRDVSYEFTRRGIEEAIYCRVNNDYPDRTREAILERRAQKRSTIGTTHVYAELSDKEGRFSTTSSSPDGLEENARTIMQRRDTDSPPSMLSMLTLWSVGRGFSPFLKEITSATDEQGLFRCTAEGTLPPTEGEWALLIDPTRAFIIKEARFTGKGEEMAEFQVTELAVNGACVFPRQSRFDFKEIHRSWDYKYDEVSLAFDQAIYDKTRAFVLSESLEKSIMIDHRGGDLTASVIRNGEKVQLNMMTPQGFSSDKPSPLAVAPSERVSRLKWWLVGTSVLVIIFLAALIVRRGRTS